ncbi:MAG: NCS1 family nucleobase:cation symporter-1 [Gemmatimonadales bacterium]
MIESRTAASPPRGYSSALWNPDLAPTTAARRTWTTRHIAALWIGMSINIPTYTLASSMVDQGWTWQAAVGAVVLGNIVVLLPIILNSHAGTKYGIPFPVLVRSSFGVLGANVPALLRAVVACGWFGIQTWIGGWAVFQLMSVLVPGIAHLPRILPAALGLGTGEAICFLAFWALNLAIVLRGMESIRTLETWGAPFLLLVGAALFVWAWHRAGGLGPMLANPVGRADGRSGGPAITTVLGAGLTSAVAFWGTMALSIPDLSRFAKGQKEQALGQALGLPATMALFAFIGAAVTNATVVIFGQRISDPVALLARVGGTLMLVVSMAGIIVATLAVNVAANIVAPANDISNVRPGAISFRGGATITAVVGILLMPWKLYSHAAAYLFTWLIGYGALLGPVGGIMIADYFVVRRRTIDLDALYRRGGPYEYTRGVNWIAMFALAVGVAPCVPGFLAALGAAHVAPVWATIYNWAWFVGFGIAAGVYLGTTYAVRRAEYGARIAESTA